MSTAVLAVDPGGTTGWASLDPTGHFQSGEVRDWLMWLRQVDRAVNTERYTVVIERYTVTADTAKKSRQYDALEIIGALKYICYVNGVAPPVMQYPAEGKAFGTDRKLHKVGWFSRGHGHANDAARHLLCYSVKHGLVDARQFLEET